jgi:hypothetical protein
MQELDLLDPNPTREAFAPVQHGQGSWQVAYVEESGEECRALFRCQGHLTPKISAKPDNERRFDEYPSL